MEIWTDKNMNSPFAHTRSDDGHVSLEERLAALIPVRHVVLTGYARNALFLLVKTMGWDSGAEIIIPAFTCSVVPMTIREAGAVPVPVDAESHGINMDPEHIKRAITSRTRAIYVVHTYGTPARMEEICAIGDKYGLKVIEDLAQSFFARHHGRNVGSFGDFSILSFTKKIINFEGGALTTNDTELYYRMMDTQAALHRERHFTVAGLTDQIVRIISSFWESRFSFSVLLVFKLLDMINTVLYRGSYGVSVNPQRFMMHGLAMKITGLQLSSWGTRTGDDRNIRRFESGLRKVVACPGAVSGPVDPRPEYFTGIPLKKSFWLRLISFRTWHNFNERGAFPRADYLYENYRVFSRIILWSSRREREGAMAYHEQEYNRTAGNAQ